MNNYFILLAAGKGHRFKSKIPKQYTIYEGKPMFEHSIEKAINSKFIDKIILVIDKKHKKFLKYSNLKNVKIINGGDERFKSSSIALNFIKRYNPKKVFIHDAARPNFSAKLLGKINKYMKKNNAVVPYINPIDTVINKKNNKLQLLKKDQVILNQTPQCFNYKELYKLSKRNKFKVTDEASIFLNNNKKIKLIKGEKKNFKITTTADLNLLNQNSYYGIGFDIHRLIKGKKLFLGGINIPFHSGLQGHSDGDVILHAITDALLGAMRKNDIGTIYPNNKRKYKNIRSVKMLNPILINMIKKGFIINNVDINLICEKPKVSKHREKIISSLSNLLSLNKNKINLKGKTVEKLGIIGKEKAIACEVIISLNKND